MQPFESDDLEHLDQLIAEHPDATLEELKDPFFNHVG